MAQIEVSFITPLFNCLPYTKQYLQSLAETVSNLPHEIILVDDFSTDGTREFLKTLSNSPYRVFLNSSNLGFAKSSNLGACHAKGKYLCFLNNDLVLKPGWLEPMLKLVKSDDQVGAVGNIQINPRTNLIDHAGIYFDLKGRPAHAWKNRKRGPSGNYGEWNAITAACMILPAYVFHKIGGFDEHYLNSFEDVDLCIRLRIAGYRLFVSHESKVVHYVSSSPGRHTYDEKNLAVLLSKWQHITKKWGLAEWPREYLNRYARHWWRMRPSRVILALWLVVENVRRSKRRLRKIHK